MKMPTYIAIAAITLDGKIAKRTNHFSDWTSKEDKKFLRQMLDKCDIILVGNNTYKTARKPLSKRSCIVLTQSPLLSPPRRQAGLEKRGVKGIYQKSKNLLYCNPKKINIKKLIRKLPSFAKGFGGLAAKNNNRWPKKIAVLGGAKTYTFCLNNNLLDELYLTVEPLVFGKGIDLFASDISINKKFRLDAAKKLNKQGSLLLKYKKI